MTQNNDDWQERLIRVRVEADEDGKYPNDVWVHLPDDSMGFCMNKKKLDAATVNPPEIPDSSVVAKSAMTGETVMINTPGIYAGEAEGTAGTVVLKKMPNWVRQIQVDECMFRTEVDPIKLADAFFQLQCQVSKTQQQLLELAARQSTPAQPPAVVKHSLTTGITREQLAGMLEEYRDAVIGNQYAADPTGEASPAFNAILDAVFGKEQANGSHE